MDAETNNLDTNPWLSYRTAWYAVVDVLSEVAPGWNRNADQSGMENAVETIRKLAALAKVHEAP